MVIKSVKISFALFVILSSYYSFFKNHNEDIGLEIPFAKIINGELKIIQDTTLLKEKLKENISFDKPIHFNSVEIVKQKTLGDLQEEYYFVLIRDNHSKVRIARWLNLIGDALYFNNKTNQNDSFEQTYLICVGKSDCYPEVFVFDNQRNWGCSKDPKCIIDPEKRDNLDCDTYKTILISELKY
ncbi:hypothetical protein [Flavobacterium lacus]|uniref:Uncharacterized protein n=1 Tax=Flavobacterium lacus TaxID=1353778 RepID=A0A328WU87_9FLAO|nr:hypothetical protein [Flavobacterium lacus]RAR48017.1 hypothetical protein B0I10_10617 [Flavobacterium lacus]